MINFLEKNSSLNNFYQQFLDQIVDKNSTSNAYIFYGPENIGKKEIATQFILKIMNQSIPEPISIQRLYENNHPDFILIEPTYIKKGNLIKRAEFDLENKNNNQPIIRIDQIRQVNKFVGRKAIQSDKKFILIEDAHLLNEASSNCLLKTLEEPTNALFILITSHINLILETIISRCQKIRFNPLTNPQMKKLFFDLNHCSKENDLSNINIENLIYISNGSPGKLLENWELCKQIPDKIFQDLKSPIKDPKKILLLVQLLCDELDKKHQEFLLDYIQCSWWREYHDLQISLITEEIKRNLKGNIQPKLSWEIGLLKLVV